MTEILHRDATTDYDIKDIINYNISLIQRQRVVLLAEMDAMLMEAPIDDAEDRFALQELQRMNSELIAKYYGLLALRDKDYAI